MFGKGEAATTCNRNGQTIIEDLSRQVLSSKGNTVSRQTVYRRLRAVFHSQCLARTESVLGAAIRVERKRFHGKTRVNTVTRYYGTMRRFAGETGAVSLGKDDTRAAKTGYTTLLR
ncbi:hypothetical protein AVEN_200445-1 [Araneus ventricosus]|uniref:Transposase Tc1-like domain-containing protein n=1 Tax=Araneus ventricosus TaxID=182803 RepID=A0A4Y2TJ86_ARAVE|nr:hypothetical protein AVEN_130285-1 [Araneus ventricosus]GBN99809.1 hypothetical protein AVEN_200445-1 [Araneus ventricosus]